LGDENEKWRELAMWDDSKQIRLNQLHEAKAQAALTERERAELSALIEERCRYETAAIEDATRQTEEKNTWPKAKIQKVQAQNHELEALIQEQEAYLAEVQPP
jgi:hypothetical protein